MSLLCLKSSSGFLSPSEQWSIIPWAPQPTYPSQHHFSETLLLFLSLLLTLTCSYTDLLALYHTHPDGPCLTCVLFPVFGMPSASYCKTYPIISSVRISTQTFPYQGTSWSYFRTKQNKHLTLLLPALLMPFYPVLFSMIALPAPRCEDRDSIVCTALSPAPRVVPGS